MSGKYEAEEDELEKKVDLVFCGVSFFPLLKSDSFGCFLPCPYHNIPKLY